MLFMVFSICFYFIECAHSRGVDLLVDGIILGLFAILLGTSMWYDVCWVLGLLVVWLV